jgi:hypothetical protein
MLGRGKVLSAFNDGDASFISDIASKRVDLIHKKLNDKNKDIYIDVSKYFARGLHVGFQNILPKFSLIHLIRDPILNMRSFLNRGKNFYLDNNSPDAVSNLLQMNPGSMKKSDLYLWSWCEMALRYESMKNNENVEKYVEIRTDQLNDSTYIDQCLQELGIKRCAVRVKNICLNTNIDSGYKGTQVSKSDIETFESFIDRVPVGIRNKIPFLRGYNPHLIQKI